MGRGGLHKYESEVHEHTVPRPVARSLHESWLRFGRSDVTWRAGAGSTAWFIRVYIEDAHRDEARANTKK